MSRFDQGKQFIRTTLLPFFLRVFLIAVIAFAFLLTLVLSGSRDLFQGNPSIMIVLGCQVEESGPSQSLQDRLDKAFAYYQENPEIIIIVSGGQGSNEPMPEAQAMSDYLVEKGVPFSKIYQENQSRNTHQNLSFTRVLMEEEGLKGDIIITSSGFHLFRAAMLWDKVGGDSSTLSLLAADVTHIPSRIHSHIRESLALVKTFVFDQGQAPLP